MLSRVVSLIYEGIEYKYVVVEKDDSSAIVKAIYNLEKELNMIYGGLFKHFKNNPDDISLKIL